jgi:membrane-associated phospholipid phosphatase
MMAPVTVRPTRADRYLANAVSAHTRPRIERAAKFVTWGADEHILTALAAGWWIYCRGKDAKARRTSDHILLTTLISSALPHILKMAINQERPDRTTIQGHWHGAPLSGKRLDAFPSGHALHVGALASAASTLPAQQRNLVWGVGAVLVLTRIVLLAHWASDVAAGLAIGAVVERMLRFFTGYGAGAGRPSLRGSAPAPGHRPLLFVPAQN